MNSVEIVENMLKLPNSKYIPLEQRVHIEHFDVKLGVIKDYELYRCDVIIYTKQKDTTLRFYGADCDRVMKAYQEHVNINRLKDIGISINPIDVAKMKCQE